MANAPSARKKSSKSQISKRSVFQLSFDQGRTSSLASGEFRTRFYLPARGEGGRDGRWPQMGVVSNLPSTLKRHKNLHTCLFWCKSNPRKLKELAIKRVSEKKEACLIYSFGSKGKFEFESGIAALLDGAPCEIHVFDMGDYERKIPIEYKHMIHYHKWGLKGSREQSQLRQGGLNSTKPDGSAVYTFHTLQETIDILGHNNRIIDVFKIDCEGCEWDTYEDWLSSNVDIRQIQVQVNSVHKNVINFFETLQKAGYVTFHKEANTIEQGRCYEYAFLKLDEAFFASA